MPVMTTVSRTLLLCAAASGCAMADFSYEQTTKITGGAMAGMMKMAGAFSKSAREAQDNTSTVAVKGDRMLNHSQHSATIMDLSKDTITHIDFQRKTYSVMTFAEMQQAIERVTDRMKSDANMSFKVSAKDTGQSKEINGLNAKEMILIMEMEGSDKKTGQAGAMTITTDMWLASQVPGYQEVRDFYKQMVQKVNWTPGNVFATQPQFAKGMAEVYKEMAKLDGVPVLQVVRMGGPPGSVPDTSSMEQPSAAPQPAPTAGEAAAGAAGGRLGRLGGLAGGLGGFGRRKKPQQEEQPKAAAPASAAQPGVLIEMTMEARNFSSAPVDSSKFEVPAGFKKVESELNKMR